MNLPTRQELEKETLLADWQQTGAAGTAWPNLAPVVRTGVVMEPGELFQLGLRCAEGLRRQFQHRTIHVKGLDEIFPNELGYTDCFVIRPAGRGTGDIATNHNLLVVVPPRQELPLAHLIELGCPHKFDEGKLVSTQYREYRCLNDGCDYGYAVDSSG